MSWDGIGDFLHMGGYGLYVWGAYGVSLGLVAIEALTLVMRERALRRREQTRKTR